MQTLALQFFGVRGSYPVPGGATVRIGGNTASVLVEFPRDDEPRTLLLDAGTGIVAAGDALSAGQGPSDLHLFLSHLHWDHVQGLPFFKPLYDPNVTLHIHAARPEQEVREALVAQMQAPSFPIPLSQTRAQLQFHHLGPDTALGPAALDPFPLSHPGGCSALRIRAAGRTIVYATDHEIGADPACDAALTRAAAGCDALVLDAHYGADEIDPHRGWGHSSLPDAAELAREAGVGALYLFHHAPGCDDASLEARLAQAREIHPRTELAAEGLRVEF